MIRAVFRLIRRLLTIAALGAVGYLLRDQLVALLTKTTGTWVGSPDSPRRTTST